MSEEPLAQWINSVFSRIEDFMIAAAMPSLRDADKAGMLTALGIDAGDIRKMDQIATRLQVIASNIEARETPKLKVIHGKA